MGIANSANRTDLHRGRKQCVARDERHEKHPSDCVRG